MLEITPKEANHLEKYAPRENGTLKIICRAPRCLIRDHLVTDGVPSITVAIMCRAISRFLEWHEGARAFL